MPGGDFSSTVSATQAVDGNGAYVWGSTAQMVADVQGWLDSPAANFGWIVLGDEQQSTTAKRFDSRQNPVQAKQAAALRHLHRRASCRAVQVRGVSHGA